MQAMQSASVLVVEDDFLQRMIAIDLISQSGFNVVAAKNADEAIAILEDRKDIRIVFTDILMPGSMDGLKLAHAIRHRWPPVELILTSGGAQLQKADLPNRGEFIAKPYDAEQLLATLKRLAA